MQVFHNSLWKNIVRDSVRDKEGLEKSIEMIIEIYPDQQMSSSFGGHCNREHLAFKQSSDQSLLGEWLDDLTV